ncbi:protein NKG7 [Spea bombifrons]|uniref:protein NKG7 n=1 Tax=Spea bombifrons TaxID=233779 RepID=UPI002348F446|nr:protein NKG7 [Spea bombifrons]
MLCGNVVGTITSCLGFVLALTGILTDFWLVDFGAGLFHEGLWQRCSKGDCVRLSGREYIDATRGLLIVSLAFLAFGVLCSSLSFFKVSVGRITASLVAGIMEFISAVFLLIGMSVYTGETQYGVNNGSLNYQWSFFLCWAAVLSLLVAGTSHTFAHVSSPTPGYESV